MKILAIDYGKKNIGLAISDELGIASKKLQVLLTKNNKEQIRKLIRIIQDHNPDQLIFGIPYGRTGEDTKQSQEIRQFTTQFLETIKNKTDLGKVPKILLWDESFSSLEAEKGKKKKFKQKKSHSEAARLILQDYLNSDEKNKVQAIN